jgi:hypothetical protein
MKIIKTIAVGTMSLTGDLIFAVGRYGNLTRVWILRILEYAYDNINR